VATCTISSTKSAILNIGHNALRQMYNIDGKSVQSVYEMRDLGVIIDSELSMAAHINYIVGKSSRRAHLITKCFLSRDRNTLVRAFLTYVRPILEYASPVWSPYTRTDICKLESVQRRFTKRLPGLRDLDYQTRLAILYIESLPLRRLRSDIIFTYKVLFGLTDVSIGTFFSNA
jgi:hypothetical protein